MEREDEWPVMEHGKGGMYVIRQYYKEACRDHGGDGNALRGGQACAVCVVAAASR